MTYWSVPDPLLRSVLKSLLFAKSSIELTLTLKSGIDKYEVYEAVK